METLFIALKQLQALDSSPQQVTVPLTIVPWTPDPLLASPELFEAVSSGNLEQCRGLMEKEKGIDLNAKNIKSKTLLGIACSKKGEEFTKICELLLDGGADLNTPSGTHGRDTPIFIAAAQSNKDTCSLLFKRGADVNSVEPVYKKTLLNDACKWENVEMCEFLLDNGADVNAADCNGNTPLHTAFLRNRSDIIELLMSRGADTGVRNKNGKTPKQLEGLGNRDVIGDAIMNWYNDFLHDIAGLVLICIGLSIVFIVFLVKAFKWRQFF